MLLFIVISALRAVTQIQTPLDSLELQVRKNYDSLTVANVEEFRASNNLLWLNFMPSVGYNIFQNTPVISFSLSGLYNYFEAKQTRTNKINSIEKKMVLDLNAALNKLHSEYNFINNLIVKFALDKQIFEAKKELFVIYSNKYDNDEIKLETFLLHKIDFLTTQKNLGDKENQIIQYINNLKNQLNINFVYKL